MSKQHRHILLQLFCTIFIASILLFSSAPPADASIAVDRSIIYLPADKPPRQDILVYNYGDQKSYIETEVFEVVDPGTDEEKLQKAKSLDELKLLVSPQKMIIAPGGRKRVRFSYLGDHKTEHVFRVNVTPVVGKVTAETTAVKLIVAYQILIIVNPENAQVVLSCERRGNQLFFTNSGNSNVLLAKAKICPDQYTPAEECEAAQISKRLYANMSWVVDLPDDQSFVEFEVTDGSRSSRKIQRFPMN